METCDKSFNQMYQWRTTMKNQMNHEVELSDKQVEFLVKCIDISKSTQSLKPDLNESKIIRKLSELNDSIQEHKHGKMIFYDLNNN